MRHVCLNCPWGSVVYPYSVFVFDCNGKVTEANVVEAPSAADPVRLVSISPLEVAFAGGTLPKGIWTTNGLYYSHDAGYRRAVEYGRETQRSQEAAKDVDKTGAK
jgi:hypothetical protein